MPPNPLIRGWKYNQFLRRCVHSEQQTTVKVQKFGNLAGVVPLILVSTYGSPKQTPYILIY